jgi:hypothetical protein
MHDLPFLCPEANQSRHALSRRSFVKAGLLGSMGLSLADLLRADSMAKDKRQTDHQKSVIILWMRGGPSQHETWDPKPQAPADYRGAFGATNTNVTDIQICDLLPMSARIMDRWSIIRSLHHQDAGHSTADQLCFTGYPAKPNLAAEGPGNFYPSCGSIAVKQLQHVNPQLPAYVMIPRMVPGTGPGYLGPAQRPFETNSDPADTDLSGEKPFRIPNLELSGGLDLNRLDDRRSLTEQLDRLSRQVDSLEQMQAADAFQISAWRMLTDSAARTAFDLDAEPGAIRERYGFVPAYIAPTPDRCGVPAWSQRILLARRLVEHGVRLVTVDCRWWDTHVKGYESMRDGFLPRWDQAYSALIEDLSDRGMLESTLVLAWGEFGRSPKVNATGGRDHYPNVFSAAIAGGKVQGGRVIGASDAKGALPAENPKSPADVLATVYDHLGIDRDKQYLDPAGRPHPTLASGTVIRELF